MGMNFLRRGARLGLMRLKQSRNIFQTYVRQRYLTKADELKHMGELHGPEHQHSAIPSLLRVKPVSYLQHRTEPEFFGLPHSKLHNVVWRTPPQNIYVVKKPWNDVVLQATVAFVNYIHAEYPNLNVIVSEDVAEELRAAYRESRSALPPVLHTVYTGPVAEIVDKTDLIVTLGGDGTSLRAVSAFLNSRVPPVLSFALGTLGFLLPFDFASFKDTFRLVYQSRSKALHRLRLECHVVRHGVKPEKPESVIAYEKAHYKQHHDAKMLHAMNDISLHRGSQPNLISLDIYIDSEFLTTTTADGMVLASPTGSTAYSLSAGGSIVNPLVPCILLTPICPRSLSFRPLILPSTLHVMMKLLNKNRNFSVKLSIDGIPQADLYPGDEIHVVSENGTIYIPGKHKPPTTLASRQGFDDVIEPGVWEMKNEFHKGIYCIARTENDWTKGINELLGFNNPFTGKVK